MKHNTRTLKLLLKVTGHEIQCFEHTQVGPTHYVMLPVQTFCDIDLFEKMTRFGCYIVNTLGSCFRGVRLKYWPEHCLS
jgi:hypothetical protein